MKIVVTGALGHIGSKLIRDLPRFFKEPTIILVDDLSTNRYCSLFNLSENARYKFIEGKVCELDWPEILKETDAVVHLAALTDAAGTADQPELIHQNNFQSTKVLSDACFEAKVPLVFPSSTSVYGSQVALVDEECRDLKPQSPYADCKIKEENYLRGLFKKGLKGVILRLGTIYGASPGMRFHTAVNKFCWQSVMQKPVTVWETAIDQKRPYLALEDCSQAVAWVLKKEIFTEPVFNVVTNVFTVREVLDVIRKYVPSIHIQFVQHKIMNQLSYKVSSHKFRETGFCFTGSLTKGIEETVSLLKNAYV